MAARMRELVLGGEGLIGRELVKLLRKKGHDVSVCDLSHGCDVRTLPDQAYKSCDRVWFLAWDTGGAKYMAARVNQHQTYKNNCEMMARVFGGLATSGTPFLFVTSQLAGQPTAYGLTKLLGEAWAADLDGKLARLWNVYGWESPSEKSHVVTDCVHSALVRGRVTCSTNGQERRMLLYKSDCVSALVSLFDDNLKSADIAGSEWVSIRSLVEEIAQQAGVTAEFGEQTGSELLIEPQLLLPYWKPTFTLERGIAAVIQEARAALGAAP